MDSKSGGFDVIDIPKTMPYEARNRQSQDDLNMMLATEALDMICAPDVKIAQTHLSGDYSAT